MCKLHKWAALQTFNRTAYGIEISNEVRAGISVPLLIAPLMELKLMIARTETANAVTFNRTAYGIEIWKWRV